MEPFDSYEGRSVPELLRQILLDLFPLRKRASLDVDEFAPWLEESENDSASIDPSQQLPSVRQMSSVERVAVMTEDRVKPIRPTGMIKSLKGRAGRVHRCITPASPSRRGSAPGWGSPPMTPIPEVPSRVHFVRSLHRAFTLGPLDFEEVHAGRTRLRLLDHTD